MLLTPYNREIYIQGWVDLTTIYVTYIKKGKKLVYYKYIIQQV